jgi:hypothetical protein
LSHLVSNDISCGLDFILSHFQEPIWPRTIFTKTLGKQLTVYMKEIALARFKQSNLLDCRINAFADYIPFHGINREPPNFIFIDIDKSMFRTDKEFWSTVEQTLKNIEQALGGKPTLNSLHRNSSTLQLNSYPITNPIQTIIQHSNHVCFEFQGHTILSTLNEVKKLQK